MMSLQELTSERMTHMLSISPNTKEYIALRKELTNDELLLLKKLLKRRSDGKYKMKKKEQKISGCFVSCENITHDDLPTNVKHIRGLLSELLSLVKTNKSSNISDSSDSTTVSETDIIDSFPTEN